VEAITETDGVYAVDPDLCTECLLCIDACPHGVMFTHPAEPIPFKCSLCGACAEACPRGAIVLTDESEKARAV
jgi:Fe-S-cluster-containing hydrogenase component 2